MPGLNGKDLAEQPCRTRPDLKVLYISGYSEFDAKELNRRGNREDWKENAALKKFKTWVDALIDLGPRMPILKSGMEKYAGRRNQARELRTLKAG